MPKKWNFLSNYGLVIIHIVQNPSATLREIARSTENRLADHLNIADLQVARQAFQTGVDPAGRKHLQEVLEAAGGQLDDTKRLRNLQDYLIPRGGC